MRPDAGERACSGNTDGSLPVFVPVPTVLSPEPSISSAGNVCIRWISPSRQEARLVGRSPGWRARRPGEEGSWARHKRGPRTSQRELGTGSTGISVRRGLLSQGDAGRETGGGGTRGATETRSDRQGRGHRTRRRLRSQPGDGETRRDRVRLARDRRGAQLRGVPEGGRCKRPCRRHENRADSAIGNRIE